MLKTVDVVNARSYSPMQSGGNNGVHNNNSGGKALQYCAKTAAIRPAEPFD